MKISKYTKLGILIFLSLTILIWGLSYLKGIDVFKQTNEYHAIYESIDGLSESNDVVLSGYKIGQVKKIKFLPDNSGRLFVTFMADAEIKIPVNSVAQIVSSDLMGTRSIKLMLSDNEKFYNTNDTIPGAVEKDLREQVSMQVLPIKNKAEELLGTIDSAITVLTVIFNEDARKNLSESFENINQTIFNIEKTTADLQQIVSSEKENMKNIISNIDNITTKFNRNTDHLEKIIYNLANVSDTLAKISVTPILDNILAASNHLKKVLDKLEETDNTAGLLLNDDQLHTAINTLSGSLNLLINDIRTNPERYVHFSAIDLGKRVYINTAGELTKENITFKIHLISSKNKIPINSDIFDGLDNVEEYETSGAYTYLTGESNSYNEIVKLYERVNKKFPEAAIVAFKNGRLIKLERALRHLK